MEAPCSTPIVALFLELSVLPIKFEIEQRQLLFLKRIRKLNEDPGDPVHAVHKEQLNYNFEENWQVIFLNCDVLIIFHSMMKTSRE